jgi:hypothetical protein
LFSRSWFWLSEHSIKVQPIHLLRSYRVVELAQLEVRERLAHFLK